MARVPAVSGPAAVSRATAVCPWVMTPRAGPPSALLTSAQPHTGRVPGQALPLKAY